MTRKLYELALWAALPMAHTSNIEGRLKMILDTTRPRRALTRRVLTAALGVAAAALIPLAMLRPMARAQATPQRAAAPAALIGITDNGTQGGRWWGVDGEMLPKPALDTTVHGMMTRRAVTRPGQQARLFAVRVPVNPRDPAPSTSYLADDETPGGLVLPYSGGYTRMTAIQVAGGAPDRGSAVEGYMAAFPAALSRTSLLVGVANGPWTERVDCPRTPGKTYVQGPSGGVIFTLIPHREPAARGSALFAVSDHFRAPSALKADNDLQVALHEAESWQRTVYALDQTGRVIAELPATQMSWPDGKAPGDYRSIKTTRTSHIPGDVLKRTASFRLVARPYRWAEFKGVALQPGQ
jgi:hypothetical protein